MKRLMIVLLATGMALSSCKSKKEVSGSSDNNGNTEAADNNVPALVVDNAFVRPKENPFVTVTDATIEGNILTLKVEFSGGCETHTFDLITNSMYKKSLPPQLDLFLKHENNGDACRKLEMRTLQFNVEGAKYPGSNTNEVVLLISDGNSDAVRVGYKY